MRRDLWGPTRRDGSAKEQGVCTAGWRRGAFLFSYRRCWPWLCRRNRRKRKTKRKTTRPYCQGRVHDEDVRSARDGVSGGDAVGFVCVRCATGAGHAGGKTVFGVAGGIQQRRPDHAAAIFGEELPATNKRD